MLLTRSLWRRPREKTLPLGNILGKKKITCTKSLKGWIIEFFKVFCFVFPLISTQDEIKWTCVLKEINCVVFFKAALLCFCQKFNVKPGLYPQLEIEVVHWIQLSNWWTLNELITKGLLKSKWPHCHTPHQSDNKSLPIPNLFAVPISSPVWIWDAAVRKWETST